MERNDEIKRLALSGMPLKSIRAWIGGELTEAEEMIFRRAQAERALTGKGKRYARGDGDTPMSGAERKRRSIEKDASIDDLLDKAWARVNWERRFKASASLEQFLLTYCMESGHALIDDAPPERLSRALADMQSGIGDSSTPYHIRIARGNGKTSFTEGACAFAGATGLRKFCVIFSAAKPDAIQICTDIFSVFQDGETFGEDFPEIAIPIRALNESWKRRQMYAGKSTRFRFSMTRGFTLPSIRTKVDVPELGLKAGDMYPSSGVTFSPRGFEGHARGMKLGSVRPDLVVLDDLQDEDEAASSEIVTKNVRKIKKTILNLGGKRKISVLMTSTPIEPDDLSETFARDPQWRTTTYKAFERWPLNWRKFGMDGLWGDYVRIYQHELQCGSRHPERAATGFYKRNRRKMDRGADVLNPSRFDKASGEISAIQALMNKFFIIGADAFAAEYQMEPRKSRYAFEITPQLIRSRILKGCARLTRPERFTFTACATDINPSYALTTTIICFDANRSAFVAEHVIQPIKISETELNETQFNAAVYDALVAHGKALHNLNFHIDAWGIDGGGKQFDAVTRFANHAPQLCALPACAMLGKSSRQYNPLVRTRIRQAKNETVLCGQLEKGVGRNGLPLVRYINWNADYYKEAAQRAWITEPGGIGGITLFDSQSDTIHDDFANQVANERLVSKRETRFGNAEYKWLTKEPHDYGDCVAMCYAVAGANDISPGGTRPLAFAPRRKRIVIV